MVPRSRNDHADASTQSGTRKWTNHGPCCYVASTECSNFWEALVRLSQGGSARTRGVRNPLALREGGTIIGPFTYRLCSLVATTAFAMSCWRSSGNRVRSPRTRMHTPCFSSLSLQSHTHTPGGFPNSILNCYIFLFDYCVTFCCSTHIFRLGLIKYHYILNC